MRSIKFLVSPALLVGASLALAAPAERPLPLRHHAIRYFDAGHTSQLHFEGEELLWLSELPLSVEPGIHEPILREKLHDCSTKALICFGGGRATFAIPRAGMAVGMKYSIGHTHYEVVKCDVTDACLVAQVMMSCRYFDSDSNKCTDGANRPSASLESGPYMSFTYNRFHGITAINIDLKTAGYEFVLQGDKGLLMLPQAPTP